MTNPLKSQQERTAPAWLLALGLCLAPAVAIGFGRFAYALILPAMRHDLGWNYSQAGSLNTANCAGYLAGALLAIPLLPRWRPGDAVMGGMWCAILGLAMSAVAASFAVALVARAIVGFAAAIAFISGAGIATRVGSNDHENTLVLGIYFGGPGVGTAVSGLLLPPLLRAGAHPGWQTAWWALAGSGALASLGVRAALTRLHPTARRAPQVTSAAPNWWSVAPGLGAYLVFGVGYIAYMTFLIAYLRGHGASTVTVMAVWTLLGLTMMAGAPLWRRPLNCWRGGRPMSLMLLVMAAGAALPLLSQSLAMLLLSAALFGSGAMSVVAAVTVLIRRNLPMPAWTPAIALATVLFAVGQSVGPLGSGALSDHYGLRASLVWTSLSLLLAAAVVLRQGASEIFRQD